MKKTLLVALGCVCALGVSWPHSIPEVLNLAGAQPTNTLQPSLAPRDENSFKNSYGHWIHARAETTEATTAAEATATTTDTTLSTATDATTTAASTASSTTTSETSTTSQTTATSTTSSTSTTTTGTSTTSTVTTTTSTATATATSTASAATAEANRKGKIAAIITFTLLGSLFFGICIVSRVRKALAKKRKAAAESKTMPVSGSTYSMLPLTDDAGRPTSEPRFDRASIMFANTSRSDSRAYSTPRGSAYFDPSTGVVMEARRSEASPGQRPVTPREV